MQRVQSGPPRSRGSGRDRRSLAVQPVLFAGEREPCFRHPAVALVCRLVLRGFRKVEAVLGVVSEDVGLFHDTTLLFRVYALCAEVQGTGAFAAASTRLG